MTSVVDHSLQKKFVINESLKMQTVLKSDLEAIILSEKFAGNISIASVVGILQMISSELLDLAKDQDA